MDLHWKGFNRINFDKFQVSKFSPLGGGGVSEAKLEKAHMTHDDWMALTNRPDVVEKDMVRLLDWFIKVDSSEDDVLLYLLTLSELPVWWNFPTPLQRFFSRLSHRRAVG